MLAAMNALAEHFAHDRRRSMIWAIGIAVVLLLAVGGAIAGSVLAGGSPGGPSPEAATLNAAVSNAGKSTGSTATAGKTPRPVRCYRPAPPPGRHVRGGRLPRQGRHNPDARLRAGRRHLSRRRSGGQGGQRHHMDLAVHVQHGGAQGRLEGQPLGACTATSTSCWPGLSYTFADREREARAMQPPTFSRSGAVDKNVDLRGQMF